MGARGKKRKRADGSVATGQQVNIYPRLADHVEEPVGVISSEAILDIMPFMVGSAGTSDMEVDEDSRAYQQRLSDVSDKHSVDEDDLASRGSRLGWLLDFKRPDLMCELPNGTLKIHEELLEFAAKHDVREKYALLEWANKRFPPSVD